MGNCGSITNDLIARYIKIKRQFLLFFADATETFIIEILFGKNKII